MRPAIVALMLALLAACDTTPPAPPAAPPRTLAAGEECPVTKPSRFEPPPGVSPDRLFGSESSHGNGKIWVGGLGPGGLVEAGPDFVQEDGTIRRKLGWWREVPGRLRITGRRLDAPAPALRPELQDVHADRGFQPSVVGFPTEGCWEVTGTIGSESLTFVLLVRKATPCPVTIGREWDPPPGVAKDRLAGWGSAHGNGTLWVGGLGDGGVLEVGRDFLEEDGSVRMKFGWWRNAAGQLTITGRRLDGPAPPLRAGIPDGYGDRGFQASGVSFPTEGCWEVTGELAGTTLTFVTLVRKITP